MKMLNAIEETDCLLSPVIDSEMCNTGLGNIKGDLPAHFERKIKPPVDAFFNWISMAYN
jgi:hypothetical protein